MAAHIPRHKCDNWLLRIWYETYVYIQRKCGWSVIHQEGQWTIWETIIAESIVNTNLTICEKR